jgi:hypothetical protein
VSTERGFIAVYRGYFDHPIFAKEPFTEREAFQWMIMEAEHEGRRVRRGRAVVMLSRGQFCHSLRFMATAWKWKSISRVSRFLEKLKNDTMIETETGQETTQVTICNYDKYQGRRNTKQNNNETPNGTLAERSRDADETLAEQTKPLNHLNTEPLNLEAAPPAKPTKVKSNRRSAEVPLPSSVEIPAAYREHAKTQGVSDAAIAREWQKFRDHAEQKDRRCAGERGWAAAWRGWVTRAIEWHPEIVTAPQTTVEAEFLRIGRMLQTHRDRGGPWPFPSEPRDRLDKGLVERWLRENPAKSNVLALEQAAE